MSFAQATVKYGFRASVTRPLPAKKSRNKGFVGKTEVVPIREEEKNAFVASFTLCHCDDANCRKIYREE